MRKILHVLVDPEYFDPDYHDEAPDELEGAKVVLERIIREEIEEYMIEHYTNHEDKYDTVIVEFVAECEWDTWSRVYATEEDTHWVPCPGEFYERCWEP